MPPRPEPLLDDQGLEKELLGRGCAIVFDASRCTSWGSSLTAGWKPERMVLAENFVVFLKPEDLRSPRAFTILAVQQMVVGKSNPPTLKIRLLCGSREQEVLLRMSDRKEAEQWKADVEERRQYLNEQLTRCEMAFVPVRDVMRRIRSAAEVHQAKQDLADEVARQAQRQLALRSQAMLCATWLRGLLRARLHDLFDWSARNRPPAAAPGGAGAGAGALGASSVEKTKTTTTMTATTLSASSLSPSGAGRTHPALALDWQDTRQICVEKGVSRLSNVVDAVAVRNERAALHRLLRWRCGKALPRLAADASQKILAKPTKAAVQLPAMERNEDVDALERLGLCWATRRGGGYGQGYGYGYGSPEKAKALADRGASLTGTGGFLRWPSKRLLAAAWSAWRFYAGARQRRHTDEVVGKLLSYNEQFLQAAGRLPVELAFSALDVAVKNCRARRLAYALYVLALGRPAQPAARSHVLQQRPSRG